MDVFKINDDDEFVHNCFCNVNCGDLLEYIIQVQNIQPSTMCLH